MCKKMFEELVQLYQTDPHSETFPDVARNRIKDTLLSRGVKPNSKMAELDPEKLSSRSSYITRLRTMLFDLNIHHNDYDETMNAMLNDEKLGTSAKNELLDFNDLCLKKKLSKWKAIRRMRKGQSQADELILSLEFQPPALAKLFLERGESHELKAIARDRVKEKTEDTVLEVQGDNMLGGVDLDSEQVSVLVASLLLVTGRRSIEIMKTAEFQPCYRKIGEVKAADEVEQYAATFKGQAKTSDEDKTYTIPLLAKYDDVVRAMTVVREKLNASELTSEQINNKYAKTLSRWTNERFGVNPHQLRAIYAIMCEKLYNCESRMTYSGYISKVLGHVTPASSIHYQRIYVENITGPVKEETLESLISKFGQYNTSEYAKKKACGASDEKW